MDKILKEAFNKIIEKNHLKNQQKYPTFAS